jgi:pimeloyl-ACP methyl ester carboxylesterase
MSSSSTHLPTPEGPGSVSGAIGGAESWGEEAGNGMKPSADDVQSVVIPDTGHWVAEQAPEEMLTALTEFLAPYRECGGGLR